MTLSPGDTLSHLVQVVMPQHANPGGITFGGQVGPEGSLQTSVSFRLLVVPLKTGCMIFPQCVQILAWVEQAAYLSAIRLNITGHVLTAAMDAVTFKEPTHVGDILYFTSAVRHMK